MEIVVKRFMKGIDDIEILVEERAWSRSARVTPHTVTHQIPGIGDDVCREIAIR